MRGIGTKQAGSSFTSRAFTSSFTSRALRRSRAVSDGWRAHVPLGQPLNMKPLGSGHFKEEVCKVSGLEAPVGHQVRGCPATDRAHAKRRTRSAGSCQREGDRGRAAPLPRAAGGAGCSIGCVGAASGRGRRTGWGRRRQRSVTRHAKGGSLQVLGQVLGALQPPQP